MTVDPKTIEMFDPSQLDLKLFTHLTDIQFEPVYDESIEADYDSNCADNQEFI